MRRFRLTPLRLVAATVIALSSSAGVAYAASLGLSTAKLHAWGQTISSRGTCNLTSANADDTYVQQANPNSTLGGTDTTLTIGGAAGAQNYAFIRFDLSSCNVPTAGGADNATLTLTVTTKSNDTISLYTVYSAWSSSTLTWNGLGLLTIGPTATTTFVPSNPGTVTITVTADVDAAFKAGTLWGWELRDTSGTAVSAVGSVENNSAGKRPSLTVNYEK
jgi:hypothetical protein